MQRAILGGILLGLLGGILGSFIILRGFSLFGEALCHSTFLGVIIGAFFGLPPLWSLLGFILVFGLVIIYIIEKTDLNSDTILSIFVAGSVALGTIGFSFLKGYRGNILSILFGDILAIGNIDLILLGILLLVTLIGLFYTLPDQILLTVNYDLAKVKGIPIQTYRYLFIVLLCLTIGLTIRSVGILLVNGFLVIPAATSRLINQKFLPFLFISAVIGAMSGIMGMIISGIFDLPSGPSIILVQLLAFLVAVFLRKIY